MRLEGIALGKLDHIAHGFFTRANGVSQGIYRGLNCGAGSNDKREHVIENRKRVASNLHIAPEDLVSAHQIHSPRTVYVSDPWNIGNGPQADAMVTDQPGIGLGILTADCTPVLLADAKRPIIGAAHAGWKGAVGGVLESVVEEMEKRGAQRASLIATIGPSISQENYEVGQDFKEQFLAQDPNSDQWFKAGKNETHFQFNLPGFVGNRLAQLGIGTIEDMDLCTYADEKRFFSYRRTTHRAQSDYGRGISVITLPK
ncbi:MAG: peptidoglycan editing factor PgeF [Parvibaculaceae bacterium]|nr:peptidoglycan editing factor PgeF [Parvibaculaceae bacterium]